MKEPFNFFDKIYCINLKQRKDRWEFVQKEFEKINILDKVQRYNAIKKEDGRIGLIKTSMNIIKHAKDKGYKNILIFEDDVKFLNVDILNETLFKSIDELPNNWEIFYLGANLNVKNKKYSEHLIQVKKGFATHSVAFNSNIYETLIKYGENTNQIKRHTDIYDVFLSTIQERGNSYLTNPILTTQMDSYSDIEKRHVNYDFIEKRFKNNVINNKK